MLGFVDVAASPVDEDSLQAAIVAKGEAGNHANAKDWAGAEVAEGVSHDMLQRYVHDMKG